MKLVSKMNQHEFEKYLEYLYSIPFVKRDCLYLPEELTFGSEVEVDGIKLNEGRYLIDEINNMVRDGYKYKCVEDLTVDSEFVMPIYEDSAATWTDIDNVINLLKDNGAKVTGRTAGHIHFGTKIIDTVDKLNALIKILCVFEPLIYKFGFGFSNEPSFFHYCIPDLKPTFTRVMDPADLDIYFKRIKKGKNLEDFCYAYLMLLHCEGFCRPVFNFRNYNIKKLVDGRIFDKVSERIEKEEEVGYQSVRPRGDHIEVRCFSGTLDTRIIQNNVGLIERIIYAVSHNLVSMPFIEKKFKLYRRKRYEFYRDLMDYSSETMLTKPDDYNNFINNYMITQPDLALWFADTFYNLGLGNEELERDLFLKQYFKLFNDEDKMDLRLK